MLTDPMFYLVAIPAVILLGLAKGGFVGVGNLAVPLIALVISPVTAAAITLPILIVQDAVSVAAFWRTFDRKVLLVTLPGAAIGVGLGWLFAEAAPEAWIMLGLGVVSVVFAAQRLWLERGGRTVAPAHAPAWFGVLCGAASGLTSQIAHAGGPPFQLYVLPKKLPRDAMIGTTAIYFALVNWMKAPAYLALGQFTKENLLVSAALMPLAIGSTLAGVWLVRRIDGAKIYKLIYAILLLLGIKLIVDAITALAA
jgi:uncharacterized membrane protein YfcA